MRDDFRMLNARTFGLRLLISRRDMGWEQERLAAESGVSRSRISEIERGKGVNVGVDSIFRLATALGVTVPYLLGLDENPLPDNEEEDEEKSKPLPLWAVGLGKEMFEIYRTLSLPDQTILLSIAQRLRSADTPRIIGDDPEKN